MCKFYYICPDCEKIWKRETKQCNYKFQKYVDKSDKCPTDECKGRLCFRDWKECETRHKYDNEQQKKKGFFFEEKDKVRSELVIVNFDLDYLEMQELKNYFIDKNQVFCIYETFPSSTEILNVKTAEKDLIFKFLFSLGYDDFTK